ncbi:MAG: phospholipase D family protein, partial [Proteobacteria bacterium]|nr:phospholipase D family protein [Pseudomonadota bacterium]
VNAKKIEIICNLTTGGTNPSEIEKLGNKLKKTGGLVKMKNDLHAKVYWTENGVIIGSANASSNGLALEGDEILGWKETAIMSTDLKIISATRKWLLDIWESAEVINKKGFIRV